MTGRSFRWRPKMSTEHHGWRGRTPQIIRILGLLLGSLMILGTVSACADNGASTPTANEQLCTDLSNLQESVQALLDVGSNETMSDFTDKWDQVKADLNDVKTSAEKVASANIDTISTAFDSLTQAVQNVPNAASISDAVTAIETAANEFINAVREAISNLGCSS